MDVPVGWLAALVRAKRPQRVPVVLTRDEVRRILARLSGRGAPALVAGVLYGTGTRLLEALSLRVKDIDFAANEITVRGGKGDRDRVTMLPSVSRVRCCIIGPRSGGSTSAIWRMGRGGSSSRGPWASSILPPGASGRGSGSSRRPAPTPTCRPTSVGAIICTSRSFSGRFARLCEQPASP